MAIFNKSDRELSYTSNENTTIITAGTNIKGEIKLSCNIYIDGNIEGNIHSSKEINIGKSGQVKGTILGNSVIVQGSIEGAIDAKRVEIKEQGRVKGEIIANELIIESKGIFEGTSVVKDAKPLKPKVKDK